MGLKSFIARPLARWMRSRILKEAMQAQYHQERCLRELVKRAKNTQYGQDHQFEKINQYEDFVRHNPIHEYEDLATYIQHVKEGKKNVLWPGSPIYLAKTSGTTSGAKYIPISRESMPFHISAARNALLCYIATSGNAAFVDGKMIFLQGSPILDYLDSGIAVGRLSGIVANHVPQYLQKNRLPKPSTIIVTGKQIGRAHV